jgi:hypothetical protein
MVFSVAIPKLLDVNLHLYKSQHHSRESVHALTNLDLRKQYVDVEPHSGEDDCESCQQITERR